MGSDVRTKSSVESRTGLLDRVANWLLLDGDRRLVAACIVGAFVGVFAALHAVGLFAVGVGSAVSRVFGSGLTAGIITLVTIALSINQLVLSRVFGSPNKLADRLDGSRELRGRVQTLAGEPASPNDPAAFLALLATTIDERAESARAMVRRADSEPSAAVTDSLAEIAEYGRSIEDHVEAQRPMTDVLNVVIGPEYAVNMAAVRQLRNGFEESLPADALEELRALDELLESLAVVRQFFKTLALQQDFAVLSRLLVYSGLIALLASVSLALVYRTDSVTVAPAMLSVVVPLAMGVVVVPLAVFSAYILRAATVASRTVSVGPFIPPEER